MRTLSQVRQYADCAFVREVRSGAAAVGVEHTGASRRRASLVRWPVGLCRAVADARLQRERRFWRAIARTTR